MRKVLATTLLLTAFLLQACSEQPSAAYTKPGNSPPAQAEVRPEVPLLLKDLDGDGTNETIAGQRFDKVTYRNLVVRTEAGKELLRIDNPPGVIVNVIVGKAGAPAPVLIVAMTGGPDGHMLTGYMYDKAADKMAPLVWQGETKNYITGLARADENLGTIVVSKKSSDGKSFVDTSYRVIGQVLSPLKAIPQ